MYSIRKKYKTLHQSAPVAKQTSKQTHASHQSMILKAVSSNVQPRGEMSKASVESEGTFDTKQFDRTNRSCMYLIHAVDDKQYVDNCNFNNFCEIAHCDTCVRSWTAAAFTLQCTYMANAAAKSTDP